MTIQFDNEQVKQRTRDMVAFLKEKGVDVPLGLGYEATARFLFGANSWNHLSGELKKGPVAPAVGSTALAAVLDVGNELLSKPEASGQESAQEVTGPEVRLVGGSGKSLWARLQYQVIETGDEFSVSARLRGKIEMAKGQVSAEFSSRPVFFDDNGAELLEYASQKWKIAPSLVRAFAHYDDTENPQLVEFWRYEEQLESMGMWTQYSGSFNRSDALRFIRAFHPHLLPKVLLVEKFGTITNAAAAGYSVRKVGKDGDRWAVKARGEAVLPRVAPEFRQDHQVFRNYQTWFGSEQEAWAALLSAMVVVGYDEFGVEDLVSMPAGLDYHESLARLQEEAQEGFWDMARMQAWKNELQPQEIRG